MRKNLLSKLLLTVLLFAALISNAQSPTAPALAFNVFTQNGCSFYSSETEGPVAMGGDLTIAGSYGVSSHGNFSYQVSGVNIGLLVGGKVNYNGGSSLQVLNNGYVKIGTQNGSKAWYLDPNNASSPIRITPSSDYDGSPNISLSASAAALGNVSANNNPIFQGGLIDFTTAFTTMKATATSMSGITANADLTNPNGDFHSSSITTILNHTPGGQIKINLASGNNILNVTGDELNSVNNFTFNNTPDASHVLIVNVNASGTFNWSAWTNGGFGGTSNCAYIIYNFYNTTTLNIGGNGAIEGTVFAPYADISKSGNNSNIEGQVVCKSYSQSAGGEIHSANFTANTPSCTLPTVADITGSSSLNVGATITLADATSSGTWSSSNTGVATVSSGGVVTGVSGGTATISYSITNSCGTTTKTKSVTIVRTDIDNKNCPSSFKRNNGDGSPQVVTVFASNVIGTTYYTNRIQPESNNNQGKVTFTYASSINYPPVITKSWADGTVNWTWGSNGSGSPFNPPGVPSSNDVAYTFYNNNLPPANVLKFELTDPQTGQVINTCSYGSDGSIVTPPTNLNYSAASATVCQGTAGNSVTPTVTASGTVTYSVSGNPTGVTINSATGVISWTSTVAAAVYTMTVTANNTFAPNATFTYTLTVNSLPVTPTFTLTQPTCSVATGTIVVASPTGVGYTYSIDGGTYQSSATFATATAGAHTVTAKNASGCTSSATATINAQPATPATPTFTLTQPTCSVASGTIVVASPTGVGYTYSIDGGTYQSSATFASVAAGTHTISVQNASGCTSSAPATINAQPSTPSTPTFTFTQPTCSVSTGTIVVASPTGAGYTYSIDGTNYQSAATFSNLAVGTYSVTVKAVGGCISTATAAVIVKANKPNDFAYTNNYLTTTQPLSSNSFGFVEYGNAAGDTYSWDFGDGTTSTSATPTKSYSAFGIYNVRLIATNTGGCSDTSYQTVVVTPASKPMDAVPVCNAATATTITQTLIFPRSTTDWASSNLKSQNAAKFDTTLGTLLAVKVINNGSFTTNNKVEITGNMAAGTKRLVNIQVDGTMDFYAPGFLYGITPPTIIDSFSSTGFDGVKDFAGTSGKTFGPHTSAKTDSTVFTSAASLANYKGSDSIALIVYTNTNFSASFPTGNDTASISTTATDTATIVYYYCPSAGGVSGGVGGGLESKSLGDAIVKRVYNKAFNSLQQPVDYSTMSPVAERTARATTMGVGTGKLTLADILPQHLSKYSLTSYISTPTDIPSITNASDVLSIDYTLNNEAKAVSFGTQTSNAVYDHTKAICDRLKGSVLIDIKNVMINNVQMVAYTLKTATGNTEYAMSFAIGAKTGRNSYTLQSNWLNQDYTADETMYNIQLWAVSPTMVTDMATDIINNLQSTMPIQAISSKKLPDTYITSGSRDRTNLVLSVTNNQTNSNGYFVIEDKSNELSTATTKRTVAFSVAANGMGNITVPMSDIYESTISMYINNQLQDVVYMADGTWSYGAGPASNVTSFKVSNDTNKTYASDELPVFRNVQVSGTSADYVSVFKLMKGGAVAQDLTAYKTLKFAAEGGYNLRITLVKSSIVNWADQYNTVIPLDKASKEYLVSLDAFTSALSKDKINANDVTTIVFSIEVGNGQNSVLNTTLNSISFTKQDASYLQSLTAKEVQLYPNPATGNRFTCSFMSDKPAQLTLRVIEMTTGQVMHTQQVAAVTGINNVQVDLNRKNAGSSVYIIALDGENVQYKKAKIIAGN